MLTAAMVASVAVTTAVSSSAATTQVEGSAATATTATSSANQYGLVDNIQQGQILQCFNWSYNDMKNNMQKIAEQGFSAIQTSPIQETKENTKGVNTRNWWVFYQPTYFRIDNTGQNALGTKAEFKEMCDEAHKYGVKVIVDAVLNHTANQTKNNISDKVDPDLKNDGSCWHDISKNSWYESRYDITQYCMDGIPDLNTGNSKVQNKAIGFLKECIDCGVDGFRFDGAKHIELPDDTGFSSQFWPNVLGEATRYGQSKGKSIYYYGEILDGPTGSNDGGNAARAISTYTSYMSVTANNVSNDIRNKVASGNAAGASRSDFTYDNGGAPAASKAVLWNESHDTWAHTKGVTSGGVSTKVIKQTWAVVGTRNEACGMFLARPSGSNEGNSSTTLGKAETNTGWADAEVKAINQFKNSMVGQSEYLSASGSIFYNERGTSGVVLVNCNGGSQQVNVSAKKWQPVHIKIRLQVTHLQFQADR